MWHMRWMMGHRRGLRVMILSFLGNGPKNGVEIMDEVEGMTHGHWRPSPGSVYPILERLTAEGLIQRRDDGRYDLTERARDEIDYSFGPWGRRQLSVDEMVQEIGSYVAYLEELKQMSPAKLGRQLAKVRELSERMAKLAKD
ncbi:MAG TPA: PadR family transcriptional regulator [Thermoplasmata archaeon]|nr:PadR family transcriptional regulator [Thermoplasmata archaeon]